jgi:hypothetical protein
MKPIYIGFSIKQERITIFGVDKDKDRLTKKADKRIKDESFIIIDFIKPFEHVSIELYYWLIDEGLTPEETKETIQQIGQQLGEIFK